MIVLYDIILTTFGKIFIFYSGFKAFGLGFPVLDHRNDFTVFLKYFGGFMICSDLLRPLLLSYEDLSFCMKKINSREQSRDLKWVKTTF